MSAVEGLSPSFTLPGLSPLSAVRGLAGEAPRASAGLVSRQQWERRFRLRLRLSDVAVVALSCAFATAVSLTIGGQPGVAPLTFSAAAISIATATLWLAALLLFNTRSTSVIGSGAAEYARVAHATGLAFGLLAILFVLFEWEGIRVQLFTALPLGTLALLVSRWAWRRWLIAQRSEGRYASRTVVVGSRDDVEYAIRTLGPAGQLGYLVVGVALLDDSDDSVSVDGVDYLVTRGEDAVLRAATIHESDTIVVASQPAGDPTYVKRLAWALEGTAAELVISSRIADVAGPRMSLRPVEGMPLIHVKIPSFEGATYYVKRALDIMASLAALALFAPIALVIALAIKTDDGGPVFFHQARVGRDGREFAMLKFRTMRVNAEAELAALIEQNEGSGLLFKLKSDPRVTRVGQFLRKFSLDEVPQFWNVLRGDMSVVGPRPPLPSEVIAYDGTVSRRLYIKPGITGPWQVGGRSDLSWEESVRLDLRYVENWTVMTDLVLMWRTAKVMISPEGAY
ncbi:sugar transferase [Microbacterium oleivorans]|uniref:sugar transferase n=1 Tax=Microbacterium oleivorans TaxID=273677 RepID=UPI0007675D36|nr:sugar transferase [Microbacterium oleivorans]